MVNKRQTNARALSKISRCFDGRQQEFSGRIINQSPGKETISGNSFGYFIHLSLLNASRASSFLSVYFISRCVVCSTLVREARRCVRSRTHASQMAFVSRLRSYAPALPRRKNIYHTSVEYKCIMRARDSNDEESELVISPI